VDGHTPQPAASTTRQLDESRVLAAFDSYHTTALRLAEGLGKAELEQARAGFLAALKDSLED